MEWEIFQAETDLDQAANNEKVIDPPASVEPPPGSWKEAAVLDEGWCIPERGQRRKGPHRQVVWQKINHMVLCVKGEHEL